jgi:hypothetical protein
MEPNDQDMPNLGGYERECAGCDVFGPTTSEGLCSDCAQKLERDLIRQRDWDYSVSAYALPDEAREELRRKVIAQFGAALELIAEERPDKKANKKKRKRRRRQRHKPSRR